MPAKMTTTQFIEKAKAIHGNKYDYSETVYTKNMEKVNVRCQEHGFFYPLANDHLSKKAGCPSCAGVKKMNTQEFITRSKKLWGDKYDYSEVIYKNFNSRIILTCDQGHRFEQLASSHLNGFNCPHCSGLAKKTTEQFVVEAKAKFGDKFDYSKVDYVNSRTPVIIVCPIVGEFEMQPIQHLISKTGYTAEHAMMFADVYRQEPQTTEYFIERATKTHGDRYNYSKSVYLNVKDDIEIICKEHGSFWQAPHNHYKGSGCPTCALGSTESKPERILTELLSEHKPVKTDKVLSDLKELDIYFQEKRVAVEINGLYWHSDMKAKTKTSHRNKYLECDALGIRLMQFTDKEVLKKQDIVVSMVKNALGCSSKLNGRDTTIREVSHEDQVEFFNENHISGGVSAKVALGLYLNGELVSCMSFNRPRFSDEADWEIVRFANKLGLSVRGAASKLFKQFISAYSANSVLSYADLRFGKGKVYKKIGFKYLRDTEVGYSYHHGNGKTLSRYQAQKHKLPKLLGDKFDPELSERDNMLKSGYYKMFDCGNKVYLWTK